MDTLNVAAINWKLAPREASASVLLSQVANAVESALDQGAQLVLLPEFAILELLTSMPEVPELEVHHRLAEFADDWVNRFSELAKTHRATVVAGTIYERTGRGYQNVCPVCLPDGSVRRAAKNRLTAYEREISQLVPGEGLLVLEDPPIGVAICYDAEFPEAVRTIAEAGARVLCVPAFTEGRRGFQRVRWCCHARTVENQVFALHASLVGDLGREPAPDSWGTSAALCPSHEPFPESAVLSETPLNRYGVAAATLDFDALAACRAGGDVRNWHDRQPLVWPLAP